MKSHVSTIALAVAACLASVGAASLANGQQTPAASATTPAPRAAPTKAEAEAFVARAERELAEFSVISGRAQWVNATYITEDTDALAAYFGTIGTQMGVRFAGEAAHYLRAPGLDEVTRRKLNVLRLGLTLPAPTTEGAAA